MPVISALGTLVLPVIVVLLSSRNTYTPRDKTAAPDVTPHEYAERRTRLIRHFRSVTRDGPSQIGRGRHITVGRRRTDGFFACYAASHASMRGAVTALASSIRALASWMSARSAAVSTT